MAIEGMDAEIQAIVSQSRQRAEQKSGQSSEADAARRAAIKKLEQKKLEIKSGLNKQESFERGNKLHEKMRSVLGKSTGDAAVNSVKQWENNDKLQSKLSDFQRNKFYKLAHKNPSQAAKAARSMNELVSSTEVWPRCHYQRGRKSEPCGKPILITADKPNHKSSQ